MSIEKKRFDNLSNSIIAVMNAIGGNDNILTIVNHNSARPFDKPLTDIERRDSANPVRSNATILPYPFSPDTKLKEGSTVRAFFPSGAFENESQQAVWLKTSLVVDIIVSKNLWLMVDEHDRDVVRPYRLMEEVAHELTNRNMDTESDLYKAVGRIGLLSFEHLSVNAEFEAIRLFFSFDNIEYIPKR